MDGVVVHFGTERVAEALEGARRFILVTDGRDEEAERLVRHAGIPWLILRAAPVIGPHDDLVRPLLKMVRALPAVPVVNGDDELQPIWYEDLGNILARAMERTDADGQVLDARGPETTTRNDLLRRLREITGRSPLRVPIPAPRLRGPEAPREKNAAHVFGVTMTPLDRALRLLADALPELSLEDGVGSILHRRFWADIEQPKMSATALMLYFREHFGDVMPPRFAAEPGTGKRLDEGATLTGKLPLRGHFQVRVQAAEPRRVLLATVEGHALAGSVEFTTEEIERGVRFTVNVWARAANVVDWIALKTIGEAAEGANWKIVVERIVAASGGTSDGAHEFKETLASPEDAA